ncbi:MAGE protein [Phaffia rhodozyma]|uniref:MAGE protein n=1 Tax=Phaffia rhodozyma TaxID=264483 RepID=A0A0F7SJM9_PHARH|nr:MAGE protein [Phaffia rhodozyma]
MARQTSRSQTYKRPSGSSSSKGKRPAADIVSDDERDDNSDDGDDNDGHDQQDGRIGEEGNEPDEGDDQDEDERARASGVKAVDDANIRRYANDVVRLALFSEIHKGVLKRDDINKKILGKSSRSFAEVFGTAQRILRKTFGMELIEIRAKGKGAGGLEDIAGAASQARKKTKRTHDDGPGSDVESTQAKSKKRAAPMGTVRGYMLRSLLPPKLMQEAFEPHPEYSFNSTSLSRSGEIEEDEKESGAIVDLKFGDDLSMMGILYVILALILVNGRRLPDDQLRAYLKRLDFHSTTVLPTASHAPTYTLDTLLSLLVRQNYLEKSKTQPIGTSGASTQRSLRGGAGTGAGEEGEDVDTVWAWGSRAENEVGEQGLTEFIGDIYLSELRPLDDETPAETEARESRKVKERTLLFRDVGRAAGGDLRD